MLPGFQARDSIIALGEGKGLVLSQERTLLDSSPGGLPDPFFLEDRKKGEGKREAFYFLIFYIPTTSFRFSEPKLKICILLSLPEAQFV